MLSNPRVYSWDPRTRPGGPPFAEGETIRARLGIRRYLAAGDGHRIPFPRQILDSDVYHDASSCRVALYVETDNTPYPGVDYVMEISLPGSRELVDRVARGAYQVVSRLRGPSGGNVGLTGPAASGVLVGANIMLDPAPLAGESHWTQNFELAEGRARVRYDYLP